MHWLWLCPLHGICDVDCRRKIRSIFQRSRSGHVRLSSGVPNGSPHPHGQRFLNPLVPCLTHPGAAELRRSWDWVNFLLRLLIVFLLLRRSAFSVV